MIALYLQEYGNVACQQSRDMLAKSNVGMTHGLVLPLYGLPNCHCRHCKKERGLALGLRYQQHHPLLEPAEVDYERKQGLFE